MFYEEVDRSPPFLLRLGLPNPQGTTGSTDHVGAIKICHYDTGYITKRIIEHRPGELLAFEVINQQIGFERSVRLEGGTFRLIAAEGGGTMVTLTTTYSPQLTPRILWRWSERLAVHTLHQHVMLGMGDKMDADAVEHAAPDEVP